MRAMRMVRLVVLSLAVLSCGNDGLSPAGDVERRQAQAKWDALGLRRYTVEARALCFCAPGLGLWHELTVENDVVIFSRLVEPLGREVPPGALPTVDAMFRSMEEWWNDPSRAREGERLRATFDPTTGLPLTVVFETSAEIPNGGVTHQYRALRPVLSP